MAAMRFLGGPADYSAKAWKWEMPAARHESLREFRVGYVLDDTYCPVTAEIKAVMQRTVLSLERAGAKLKPGWPAEFKIEELYQTHMFHLDAFLFTQQPDEVQEAGRKAAAGGEKIPGLSSFADWQQQNFKRLGYRAQWQAYFEDVDVFLSPVAFTTAFAHDHRPPLGKRTIATTQGPREYMDLVRWIAPPTLTGCPATVAPLGPGGGELPIGLQIMGPFWEDATPIVFAKLLAREVGGFVARRGMGASSLPGDY